jgi:hypothetical protein
MAKHPCPICGANHKDAVHQCRLCGAVMDGTVDPMGGVAVQTRAPSTKKKGTGGFAAIGLLAVLVILLVAIALGVTSGDLSVGKIRDRIPFLRTTNDGWVKVDDPEGGFRVDMPSSRRTTSALFDAATTGRITGWSATIGTDTTLAVLYGKITVQPGESGGAALQRFADLDVSQRKAVNTIRNVTVDKQTVTTFRGYPAIAYTVSGNDVSGKYGYEKTIVFLKGDMAYSLASLSVYRDHPQFDRFANSFHFTA